MGGTNLDMMDWFIIIVYSKLFNDCAFSFSVSVTLTNVIDDLLIAMFGVSVMLECLNGEYE